MILDNIHDDDIGVYCALLLDELKKLTICDKKFTIYIFEKDTVNICKDDGITKDGIHIIIGVNVKQRNMYIYSKWIFRKH